MPFVTQAHREHPDLDIPGDRCYTHYRHLVSEWKKEPRWTTAHRLYKDYVCVATDNDEDAVACSLAWQVFFIKYVMPYEDLKEKENGTI